MPDAAALARARAAILATSARGAELHEAHLRASARAFEGLLGVLRQPVPAASLPPVRDPDLFDPAQEAWVLDHRPCYTVPVVPGMWMVDRLAQGALALRPGLVVAALEDVTIHGWLLVDRPRRLRVDAAELERGTFQVKLSAWRESERAGMSRFEPVASGRVLLSDHYSPPPPPLPALTALAALDDPYRHVFLGPAFQLLTELLLGAEGASGILDLARSGVPPGVVRLDALDGATHLGIPRSRKRWYPELQPVNLPHAIPELRFHSAPPLGGRLRAEMRAQPAHSERFSESLVQIWEGETAWASYRLKHVLLPIAVPLEVAREYLGERRFIPRTGFSIFEDGRTRLTRARLSELDWPRGSVAFSYRLDGLPPAGLARAVAVREHAAQRLCVHPSAIAVGADGCSASAGAVTVNFTVDETDGEIVVADQQRATSTPSTRAR